MSNHNRTPQTGAVDRDRNSPATKMDREEHHTGEPEPGSDIRGSGRQMKEQQQREKPRESARTPK